jgi:hypothetical protein
MVFSRLCFDLHWGRRFVKAFHKFLGVHGLGEIRNPDAFEMDAFARKSWLKPCG